MAEIAKSKRKIVGGIEIRWLAMATGDTSEPVGFASMSDRSIQVEGTFGGATVNIEGSNDKGATWAPIQDAEGALLTFTAAGLKQVLEVTGLIRATVTGGAASGINVSLTALEK